MKTLVSSIALATTLFLLAVPAHAGPQQGVTCPADFSAAISTDHRNLKCQKTVRYVHKSVCSPVAFSSKNIRITGNIVMEPTGVDQCLAVGAGTKTDSVMEPPLPGEPPYTAFRRVVNQTGPDTFVAEGVVQHSFPVGTPFPYVGNAANGVTCPSGFDGDKVADGRGIRCDRYDGPERGADCDFVGAGPVALGWNLQRDHRGAEDRCLPVAGGADGPTKPVGMTKIQHDAERASDSIGWILRKNSGADKWQRKVYEFPRSN
jgi:hypothetical protein